MTIYNSRLWRDQVRPQKLARDPMCQALGEEVSRDGWPVTRQCPLLAAHVDHWQPMSKGGDPWADSNLVSLCHGHHSAKTACEQRGQPVPFAIVPSAQRRFTLA